MDIHFRIYKTRQTEIQKRRLINRDSKEVNSEPIKQRQHIRNYRRIK